MFRNPLRAIAKELSVTVDELQNAFNGEWDDPIHDSYFPYVKNCKSISVFLSKASRELDQIFEELNELEIEELLEESKQLDEEMKGALNDSES